MDNLNIYNQVRAVPKEAQKEIKGGRLSGKTDINPMWRIRELTNLFGICGIGWKYEITKQWLEDGANGEIAAFVNINLYIKVNSEWSDAIPGNGGSMFIAMENDKATGGKKPYVSDECFKMALTDAISVSCKALGFGADIYWQADSTKYSRPEAVGNSNTQGRQNQQAAGQSSVPVPPPTVPIKQPCQEENCKNEVLRAQAVFCINNPHRFGGKVYCRECQDKHKAVG